MQAQTFAQNTQRHTHDNVYVAVHGVCLASPPVLMLL